MLRTNIVVLIIIMGMMMTTSAIQLQTGKAKSGLDFWLTIVFILLCIHIHYSDGKHKILLGVLMFFTFCFWCIRTVTLGKELFAWFVCVIFLLVLLYRFGLLPKQLKGLMDNAIKNNLP